MGRHRDMLKSIFGLILLGLGCFVCATYGPDVLRDHSIDRSTLMEAPEYDLPDGNCSNALVDLDIIFACKFSLKVPESTSTKTFHYLLYSPTETARAVALKSPDGKTVTLAYGITHLPNRTMVLGFAMLITLVGVVLLFRRKKI